MQATNLADLYELPMLDWDTVQGTLDEALGNQGPGSGGPDHHTVWLATINPDGTPHLTGVGALWVDGAFWFKSGAQTRKGRNLAREPRCTLSVSTRGFDVAVDGAAEKVTDPATVADMASRWAAQGWPARVADSGVALTAEYSAPSAGPPPWDVFRFTPRRATAVGGTDPGGATSWSF